MQNKNNNRRNFIKNSSLLIAGSAIFNANLFGETSSNNGNILLKEEDVSPNEDLMREHGLLKRILLIYQEIIDRINANAGFPPDTVIDSANTIRIFIESYHERLEEEFLFPRFKKANTLVDLVNTLITQHEKGRILTGKIVNLGGSNYKTKDDKKQLKGYLYSFIRMYAPHEAREDTILFPAFKKLVSQNEYDSLGEQFEKRETDLFGPNGFELMVHRVEDIEKKLDIYNLSKFTPKI